MGETAPTRAPAIGTSPDAGGAVHPTEAAAPRRQRVRTGKKRLRFKKLPRPAYPVRALWDLATPEEKERAHRQCVAILEWWLGKSSRQTIAERLELPSLRVWQLSQQALSGMLAGLLRQPKARPRRGERLLQDPKEDLPALRREIAELKKKLRVSEELNAVLRDLKATAQPKATAPPASSKHRKPARRAAARRKTGVSPTVEAAAPAPRP